jgi:hypothetical protein
MPGDNIFIPTKDMTVEIRLANTEAETYAEFSDSYNRESIHVAYVAGKSARWYVRNMAGGYGKNAKRTNTNVIYANGTAKDYHWYRLRYRYPKVKPGSKVVVGGKPTKEEREKKDWKEVDWEEFSMNLIAQVTSVLTVVTLATKL